MRQALAARLASTYSSPINDPEFVTFPPAISSGTWARGIQDTLVVLRGRADLLNTMGEKHVMWIAHTANSRLVSHHVDQVMGTCPAPAERSPPATAHPDRGPPGLGATTLSAHFNLGDAICQHAASWRTVPFRFKWARRAAERSPQLWIMTAENSAGALLDLAAMRRLCRARALRPRGRRR